MKPQPVIDAIRSMLEDVEGLSPEAATLTLAACQSLRQASDLLDAADRLGEEETPW